ncbi:MAG: hypothetical protein AAGG38_10835 [Planctomycetota bacterium]
MKPPDPRDLLADPVERLEALIDSLESIGVTFINFETAADYACQNRSDPNRVRITADAIDILIRRGRLRCHGDPTDSLCTLFLFG